MGLYVLEMISPWGCNFWMGGLAYDSIPPLELSLQSLIEFTQKNPVMVPRSTIHKQKRKFFTLISVLSCLPPPTLTFHKTTLRYLKSSGKRCSSKVTSGWVHGSEDKKGSGGEDPGGSWEIESCRGEGEKNGEVFLTTLRWGARRRGHPIGGSWRIPGYRI